MKFLKLYGLPPSSRSPATQFLQAFNTVAHNKLLLKLAHHGIQYNTHQWVATWLTTRTQNVIVEGERSKDKRVLSGVPHRELLWDPLCFYCILMKLTETNQVLFIYDIMHGRSAVIPVFTLYSIP